MAVWFILTAIRKSEMAIPVLVVRCASPTRMNQARFADVGEELIKQSRRKLSTTTNGSDLGTVVHR